MSYARSNGTDLNNDKLHIAVFASHKTAVLDQCLGEQEIDVRRLQVPTMAAKEWHSLAKRVDNETYLPDQGMIRVKLDLQVLNTTIITAQGWKSLHLVEQTKPERPFGLRLLHKMK